MSRSRSRSRGARPETAPARRTDVERLTDALGVGVDPELLVLALTHRSFAHEAGGLPTNERLEFLGDSVLGLVVTEHLYRSHPDVPEGDLARMRAATVSQRALAAVARGLDLGEYVLLGRGEAGSGGREKDSILSDALEALIGAVYLGHGLETTREVVMGLVADVLQRAGTLGAGLDWKSSLQELAARAELPPPAYTISDTGPDHARVFTAVVTLDGEQAGSGSGTSKKIAELEAAEQAYTWLAARVAKEDPAEETRVSRKSPDGVETAGVGTGGVETAGTQPVDAGPAGSGSRVPGRAADGDA